MNTLRTVVDDAKIDWRSLEITCERVIRSTRADEGQPGKASPASSLEIEAESAAKPELPEVEAARRAIEKHCAGKKIRVCVVDDDPRVIDCVSRSEFESSLAGKTIVAALRKGKILWLQLDSPPFPSFKFGMSGAVRINGVAVTNYNRAMAKDNQERPLKHVKVFVVLEDGLNFSFTDERRFAQVCLLQDPKSVPPISELGPDALTEPMQVDEFVDSLSKKKVAIKVLLLDQSFISGIGNWIADEVLYQKCPQAQIHPLQTAASLSKDKCESLHRSIKEVIQCAVEVDADSSRFPIEWLYHVRWGKRSGEVNGKKIDFITVRSRTSAYVPELQKFNEAQSRYAVARGKLKRKKPDGHAEEELGDSEEALNRKPKSKKISTTWSKHKSYQREQKKAR